MPTKSTWAVLLFAGSFFIAYIVNGAVAGLSLTHWSIGTIVFAVTFMALAHERYRSNRMRQQLESKESELRSLKGNLAAVVKEQFKNWPFSNSESQVAWLILKGFSFNEISAMRSVAAKTVRIQAGAVYRKSGAGNRSEFTASFLDDLLNIE